MGWVTHKRASVLRALMSVVAPLTVALPPLFWVADATRRASLTPLGRDQGIFQYIAWALSRGVRDYRDVRDVNGPLTHLIHVFFLRLGGADEHRFRLLDLAVTTLAFAFVGACLPGVLARPGRAARRVTLTERAGWALASWVVLSAQYLAYVYWDLAQRESFFDWFMLSSVALQLVAQSPTRARSGEDGAKRHSRLLYVVGALSVIPWFGKPTYVLFTFVQLLTLAIDRDIRLPGLARFRAFGIGAAVAAASQLVLLAIYGDLGAYARIAFVDVPAMYRFIWPRAAFEIFSQQWFASDAIFGITGGVTIVGLIAHGQLPRRALAVALVPACGLLSVIAQAKGFPYHFHPVTAGIALQWIVLVAWLWETCRALPRRRALARALPFVASACLALRVATEMEDSPHIKDTWIVEGGATPELRETPEYFAGFPEPDYFPWDMRLAAEYLRAHTEPAERVQTYGMDPYVLFLAQRLSATPYIYVYDLDADAALTGGTGAVPDDEQQGRIRAIRDAHERDMLARLQLDPPAAFVFLDRSPLMSVPDAWADFAMHCPSSATWVSGMYREAAVFGADHVWMRRDRAQPKGAASP